MHGLSMAIPSWWIAKGGTLVAWAPSALAVTTSASGAEYTLTAQKDAAAQDLIYQPQPVNAPMRMLSPSR